MALGIVLLVLLGWQAVGWSLRHLAQARLRPSRATYERLLAQTHAALGPDNTIIISDPNGAALSLRIDYFKEIDQRPSLPLTYEFFFGYDHVAISPEDDPDSHPFSVSDYGMHLSHGASLTLRQAPDAALSVAINDLVDWSIADAQASVKPRYDFAAGNSTDSYFVRCDPAQGWYYLLLRQQTNFGSLRSMQSAQALGYVSPVTTFHRAHLWRYLIDHYAEIQHLTEDYLIAKRNGTVNALAR